MSCINLSRREWAFILFPSALFLFLWLDPIFDHSTHPLNVLLNPLARARENNYLSSCQSNMKQLGIGMLQYARDNDNTYPLSTTPTQNWVSLTMPYTKSTDILRCPSDLFLHSASTPKTLLEGLMTPSYWMNSNLNDAHGYGLSTSIATHPQRTFLMGDWKASLAKSPFVLNEKSWVAGTYGARHLFGANYLFNDGHVKWLSSDDANAVKSKRPISSLYSWQIQ